MVMSIAFVLIFSQRSDDGALSQTSIPPAATSTAPADNTQNLKTYRNEEWGFEFRYPVDWEVKENVYGNAVIKFNLVMQPIYMAHFPDPVSIDVLPSDWIEGVHKNFEADGIEPLEVLVDGVKGVKYEHLEEFYYIDYFLPLGDDVIVIGSKKEYENTLNQIIPTFRFLK